MKKNKILNKILMPLIGIASIGTMIPTISSCSMGTSNKQMLNTNMVVHPIENSTLVFWREIPNDNVITPNLEIAVYKEYGKLRWNKIELEHSSDRQAYKLVKGNKYLVRGDNPRGWDVYDTSASKYKQAANIKFEGSVYLSGTILSLIDNGTGKMEASDTSTWELPNRCFSSIFKGSDGIINVNGIFLPSEHLGEYCYNGMFRDCINLVVPPYLPATTVKFGCYNNLYNGCSSLQLVYLGYSGTRADNPSCFDYWVDDIYYSGKFYYNGTDDAGNFGFPIHWIVRPW